MSRERDTKDKMDYVMNWNDGDIIIETNERWKDPHWTQVNGINAEEWLVNKVSNCSSFCQRYTNVWIGLIILSK